LRIKLYPKKITLEKGPAKKRHLHLINQKQVIKQWFGVSRICYNKAVDILNTDKISFYDLRKQIISDLDEEKPFTKSTPYDIKANAIKDAFTAVLNAKTKSKATRTWNTVCHRLKKDATNSIYIPRAVIKEQAIYIKTLNKIKSSEPFTTPKQDSRICYNSSGFYLQVPHTASAPTDNQGKFGKFVSLDPGVRTFMTAFSNQGVFEFGISDIKRISRLQHHLSNLKGSRKRNARARVYKRIQHLIDDLHWKVAKFLTTNFENIYIPEFNVGQMVQSNNLRSVTKREMLALSHYKFRMRLIHAAHKYGSNIFVVNESYTSKTCTNCGVLNDKLGSSKTFNCNTCGLTLDRDINGARNVLLRALVDSPL
jgi:putative transposase